MERTTAFDPERVLFFKKQIAATRKAREKKKQDELDESAARRLAYNEQQDALLAAGQPEKLKLLAEFGEAVLVFSPEWKLASSFAWTTYRSWIQAAIGPGLQLNDAKVLQTQEAFDSAFAEVFGLEQVESYANATKGTVVSVGPNDSSKRWAGVAVTRLRDRDAEYRHWQHLRREGGANSPADPSEVSLGGMDLEVAPAAEPPQSELIPARQRGVLAHT